MLVPANSCPQYSSSLGFRAAQDTKYSSARAVTLTRLHPALATAAATIDALALLPSLAALSLPQCGLRTLQHVAPLGRLTSVTELNLAGNPVTTLTLLPSLLAASVPYVVRMDGADVRLQRAAHMSAAQRGVMSAVLTAVGAAAQRPIAAAGAAVEQSERDRAADVAAGHHTCTHAQVAALDVASTEGVRAAVVEAVAARARLAEFERVWPRVVRELCGDVEGVT